MRIVLDSNVIVAGLISPNGPPARLLGAWLDGGFWLVTSTFQLDELARVLTYRRIRERLAPGEVDDFLANVPARAEVIRRALPTIEASTDPDDNLILATAVAGRADLMVSGDKSDMLRLGAVEGIPIVTPREALARLR